MSNKIKADTLLNIYTFSDSEKLLALRTIDENNVITNTVYERN